MQEVYKLVCLTCGLYFDVTIESPRPAPEQALSLVALAKIGVTTLEGGATLVSDNGAGNRCRVSEHGVAHSLSMPN